MAVQHYFTYEPWRLVIRFQKFTEQECLAAKLVRQRMIGQQVAKLVAKYGGAAWFENNHRSACSDFRFQSFQYAEQIIFRKIQHSEVVQWPAAAQLSRQDAHRKSRVGEHLHGGAAD